MMDREHLIKTIEAAGYDAQAYSGRGMMGRKCVSFTANGLIQQAMGDLVAACDNIDDAMEIIRKVSTDSMGLGTVFYWKSVVWEDAP